METTNTLALLLAGPWHGQDATHHDLLAVSTMPCGRVACAVKRCCSLRAN